MVIMHELAPALRPFVFFPGESILLALLLLCPAKTGDVYIYPGQSSIAAKNSEDNRT